MKQNDRRILIVQTAFLGDVILITPLIRAVKELFPSAEIDVLVIPETKDILRNNPYIRDILVFDKRDQKWIAWINLLGELRKKKYDLAISPHSSFTTALLLQAGGIRERVGFDRNLGRHFLTKRVTWLRGIHRIQKNLHLLTVFTDKPFSMQTEVFPGAQEKAQIDQLLITKEPHRPMIAIAPGSMWKTKCWEEDYYVQLAKGLTDAGYQLLFTGSPAERLLCERIISQAGISAFNLAGMTSILASAEAIRRCKLLICNDSGALHLGNAVQTDVFAFFGPTVKYIGYYPYREHDFVFESEIACRPCGSHGADQCPRGHHKCMKAITPEQVLAKVREVYGIHVSSD